MHLEYFFAISWSIWHNRNLCAHNKKSLSPLQIWEMARSFVEDFQDANLVLSPTKQPSNRGWESPPSGFFKINVDGATSLDGLGVSRVGVII